jgi:hypothetical protein
MLVWLSRLAYRPVTPARLESVAMNLGDVNRDGFTNQIQGNRIKTAPPSVELLEASNEADVEGTTQQPICDLV